MQHHVKIENNTCHYSTFLQHSNLIQSSKIAQKIKSYKKKISKRGQKPQAKISPKPTAAHSKSTAPRHSAPLLRGWGKGMGELHMLSKNHQYLSFDFYNHNIDDFLHSQVSTNTNITNTSMFQLKYLFSQICFFIDNT